MIYSLPTSLEIGGTEYEIRSDYRAVLDILTALAAPELCEEERVIAALIIFYPAYDTMPPECFKEAVEKCFWFINGGQEEKTKQKSPRLVDWEQDFPLIIAPINRIMGREIRADSYLHWWTFLSAYREIGDCTFAQIVRVRDKRARGKPLDKAEKEWYRGNREIVDIKTHYTDVESDLLKSWTSGGG